MLFFPLPGTYAVVELDVERTLQFLDDPVAHAAGAAIKTTKCIVYLDTVLRLPFPEDETFKYSANLIGPRLRPEDAELCITPDMCIPIYPNTSHPSADRAPLRSEPPFPFSNCYHWFGADMWLDLRIANDGRDYRLDPTTELPAGQHVKMVRIAGEDIWRSICARREDDALVTAGAGEAAPAGPEAAPDEKPAEAPTQLAAVPLPSPPTLEQQELDDVFPHPVSAPPSVDECEQCTCGDCHSVSSSEYDDSDSSSASFYQSSDGENDSIEALDEMDIFGRNGDERDDLLPIVKISLDLGAHFELGNDVPDPMEFMRQRDELVRIIEESKARAGPRANGDARSTAANVTASSVEQVSVEGNTFPVAALSGMTSS